MVSLLICLVVALNQAEGMIVRRHGKKHGEGGMFFNAIVCLFAMVFFLVKGIIEGFNFPGGIFIYGIISCFLFAMGFYSTYAAMKIGSYVATGLVGGFSGVVTVLYGFIFLKEPYDAIKITAIVLVFMSLVLMQSKKEETVEKKKLSVKWFFWAVTSAVCNGFISVVMRMQQMRFENKCSNEFMLISFGGAFLFLLILGLLLEKDRFGHIVKTGFLPGAGAGLVNGGKNLALLITNLFVPISILTPARMGLGFVVSFAVSVTLYKEKFTGLQILSVVIGVIALLMFSI